MINCPECAAVCTVTAYDRQREVIEQFNKSSDELTRVGIIAEILGGSMGSVMNVINNIGFVIIAAFGGYFALKGMQHDMEK